jgi:hypothetical protein
MDLKSQDVGKWNYFPNRTICGVYVNLLYPRACGYVSKYHTEELSHEPELFSMYYLAVMLILLHLLRQREGSAGGVGGGGQQQGWGHTKESSQIMDNKICLSVLVKGAQTNGPETKRP